MGLSVTASHVIWFVAIVGLAGAGLGAFFGISGALEHAEAQRRAIDAERLDGRLGGATFCYDAKAQRVFVNATNAGSVPLDLLNVSFVMDGQVATGFAASSQDGETTLLWAPGEWTNFTKTGVASEPSTLSLATEHGVLARATKVSCPYLASIVVTPGSADVTVGGTRQFSAAGYDQFGASYPVSSFAWTTNAGSVDATGLLTASTTASTGKSVMATVGAVSGSATVDLIADAPASLTISPSSVTIAAGSTEAFSATVLDPYGNVNATATVSWGTTAGSLSGSTLTAPTSAPTSLTVTATSGSASNTASVSVQPAAPASVSVSPASATVLTRATQPFSATALDAYGNTNTTATIAWSATRGSVTSGGLYTAPTTTGSDTVTATTNGHSGSATVTVQQKVHASNVTTLLAGNVQTTFARGDTVTVRVTVVDQNGFVLGGVTTFYNVTSPVPATTAFSPATNAGGMSFGNLTIPNPSSNRGAWTIALSNLQGADANTIYDAAAAGNVASRAFTVS
ncbi:MAG: large repetitive protein [Thermoplasmata archaeon]|jgi:archaellum component FlaF (FlaF/FlaG flagellin family)|nr:large repetitive protein [Thermoplasmata archaeon]